MHVLQIEGATPAESFTVPLPDGGAPVVLGRGEGCDLVLPDAERNVGRQHVRVTRRTAIEIEDLRSKNGTWHEGERVRRAVLVPGDEFTIGRADRYRIAFVETGEPEEAPQRVVPDGEPADAGG